MRLNTTKITLTLLVSLCSMGLAVAKDCGKDYSCFLQGVRSCRPVRVEQNFKISQDGINRHVTRTMEIQGLNNGKCVYEDLIRKVEVSMQKERRWKLIQAERQAKKKA